MAREAVQRQCIYWPGITRDVEELTKKCEDCELYKASYAKEPLLRDEAPTRPAEAIAADLFNLNGKEYLVITDKYSGWPEIYSFNRSFKRGR